MLAPFIKPRFDHWKSILWRPVVTCTAFTITALGFIAFLRDDILKKNWKFIDLIPHWTLQTWACVLLLALLLFTLEGSYRLARDAKVQHEAELAQERQRYKQLSDELSMAADMQGTVGVSLELSPEDGRPEQRTLTLRCAFDCVNRGNKSCQITRLSMEAVTTDGNILPVGERLILKPIIVDPERAFLYQASFFIGGLIVQEIPKYTLRVILSDSLGRRHTNIVTTVSPLMSGLS